MSHSGQQGEKEVGEMSALSRNLKKLLRPGKKVCVEDRRVKMWG